MNTQKPQDFVQAACHARRPTKWRAPWKNWISSTIMKLRKSLVKPVTRQNISSCLVLPPEIVMLDAFNVILWISADICVVLHDDLGWKNRTTRYNCRFSVAPLALRVNGSSYATKTITPFSSDPDHLDTKSCPYIGVPYNVKYQGWWPQLQPFLTYHAYRQ